MKIYTFKYDLGNTINNTMVVEAENINQVYTILFDLVGDSVVVTEVTEE